jgi:hypothetical protein
MYTPNISPAAQTSRPSWCKWDVAASDENRETRAFFAVLSSWRFCEFRCSRNSAGRPTTFTFLMQRSPFACLVLSNSFDGCESCYADVENYWVEKHQPVNLVFYPSYGFDGRNSQKASKPLAIYFRWHIQINRSELKSHPIQGKFDSNESQEYTNNPPSRHR